VCCRSVGRRPTGSRLLAGAAAAAAADPVERAIVDVAEQNQTDGYRMVAALTRQKLGRAVNRKRVLRERKLIQRQPPAGALRAPRLLPGRATQAALAARHDPDLSRRGGLDLSERNHRLLHPREIVGWQLELRCRANESIAVVERAAAEHAIEPDELVLGTDNGSAFTARRFKARLGDLEIRHRPTDLGGATRTPKTSGLNCQLRRGACQSVADRFALSGATRLEHVQSVPRIRSNMSLDALGY